jgi:hypothetical protein
MKINATLVEREFLNKELHSTPYIKGDTLFIPPKTLKLLKESKELSKITNIVLGSSRKNFSELSKDSMYKRSSNIEDYVMLIQEGTLEIAPLSDPTSIILCGTSTPKYKITEIIGEKEEVSSDEAIIVKEKKSKKEKKSSSQISEDSVEKEVAIEIEQEVIVIKEEESINE